MTLPRSSPSAVGVDAAGITAFLDALESTPDVEVHSLMLVRHGAVVAEGWWHPYTSDRVHLLYSLSKSFTSSALGFAVAEGLVDIDATVLSYFPELDAEITDPRSRSMLVRHVAAMASGHLDETVERAYLNDPDDLVRGFLLIPPDREPGSVFAYNQPCTFAVAAIVQRVSGQSLTEFLRPRLFDPLGIGALGWTRDASGREIGYSGLHASTEAVAKLGLLYLQGGRWEGEQLLPAEWVAQATSKHIDNPNQDNVDWQQGYGFQFWMARHGYRGDGAFGQFCVILPEQDAVLAITGQSPDMQAVLDAAWEHLLPVLGGRAMPSPAADAALAARLAAVRITPVPGAGPPPGTATQSYAAADGNDQPSLTEVRLVVRPEGGCTIALTEGATQIEAELGIGDWVTTGVVATSGGWVTSGHGTPEVQFDVAFIETPHRLRLVCHLADSTVECRWITEPLWPSTLAQLRMPGAQAETRVPDRLGRTP